MSERQWADIAAVGVVTASAVPSRLQSGAEPRQNLQFRPEVHRVHQRPGQTSDRRGSADGRSGPSLFGLGKLLLIIATVLMSSLLFASLIFLPATEIQRVEIVGAASLSDAQILAWAPSLYGANWFSLDLAAVEADLARNPRLETVGVERRFPDSLILRVSERQAVAVVYAKDEGGQLRAHCIDRYGVIFGPLLDGEPSLPIISGLEIHGLQYGFELGQRFRPFLASLQQLQRTQPVLVAAISELRLVDRQDAGLEVLLYPVHYPVPVRMRPELSADILKSMLLVLDVVDGRGLLPTIKELDFRTDTYVYRTKEAISG